MKIFISFDWEGISGISSWRMMSKDHVLFKEAQKNVELEIKAIIDGIEATKKKISEVTICDSHAFGENIEFYDLPDYVNYIRGFPRKYYMVSGLSDAYDGVIFLGYHSPVGTKYAPMDHTYSSSSIFNIKINGKVVGESEINGLFAGDMQIPVLLITGDDKLFSFSSSNFARLGTEFIITKEGYGRYAAKIFNIKGVLNEIREKIKNQINNMKDIKPFKWKSPYELEIEFIDTLIADIVELIPGVKRISGRVVQFQTNEFKELYRALIAMTLMGYSAKNI
ncbi:M55 family metallopeptidase [bacterium]|nr:M55 family metallopeptidase [bacterium]